MFWKLAVSALVLPAYLGFGAVTAEAAVLQKQEVTTIASQNHEILDTTSALQQPEYIANNYDDCNGGYRRRNNYYRQNSYRQNSYHRSNYRPRYYQNSYQGGHGGRHNNGYYRNNYQGGHNGGHNNGYYRNNYQGGGYNH
ncbi:MAG: hypothetical protein HC903_16705 [Methylacidiphilales bacterium]|nr:hypothetical protein [Candidatus Methylacidiphilales bacterium]NJR16754.1 hypothetical protein [Calothrix sp. CSU_2_0]